MSLISKRLIINRIIIISIFVFSFCTARGQQTPFNPVTYWVFTPYIYNPGMVGSKDYISAGINAAFRANSNSQLLSGNSRISKTRSGYFSSPDIVEFKNVGIGGSVFRDLIGISKNIGMSVSVSYQIPLNTRQLSFISLGVSLKGVYNTLDNGADGPARSFKKTFYPDLDLGIYYYSTSFFTGISTTNIMGNPFKSDSLAIFRIPVSRQYFFTAGLKILLSKPMNIVLEPSVLIVANDSAMSNIADNIIPIIKLYLEDFCFGTSYSNKGTISFFTQYRYPKFYVGAYYEIPKNTPYFKKTPIVEFTLGLNIQTDKSRLSNHSHW
jgi:type IX secretion system PorP/SprF family membrane protein